MTSIGSDDFVPRLGLGLDLLFVRLFSTFRYLTLTVLSGTSKEHEIVEPSWMGDIMGL